MQVRAGLLHSLTLGQRALGVSSGALPASAGWAQEVMEEASAEAEVEGDAGGEEDPAAALSEEQLRSDLEAELGSMAVEELKGVNVRLLLAKLGEQPGAGGVGRGWGEGRVRVYVSRVCGHVGA